MGCIAEGLGSDGLYTRAMLAAIKENEGHDASHGLRGQGGFRLEAQSGQGIKWGGL